MATWWSSSFGIEPACWFAAASLPTAKGPRFEYRMRLDRMSAKEIDLLAFAVTQSHRRQAIARSNQRTINKLPTTERLTRESVRVLAQFAIMYRTSKEDFKPAKAVTCRPAAC